MSCLKKESESVEGGVSTSRRESAHQGQKRIQGAMMSYKGPLHRAHKGKSEVVAIAAPKRNDDFLK